MLAGLGQDARKKLEKALDGEANKVRLPTETNLIRWVQPGTAGPGAGRPEGAVAAAQRKMKQAPSWWDEDDAARPFERLAPRIPERTADPDDPRLDVWDPEYRNGSETSADPNGRRPNGERGGH